jgi:hypothetical protein
MKKKSPRQRKPFQCTQPGPVLFSVRAHSYGVLLVLPKYAQGTGKKNHTEINHPS